MLILEHKLFIAQSKYVTKTKTKQKQSMVNWPLARGHFGSQDLS